MLTADLPLAAIPGISTKFVKRLATLGVGTVRDLLFHFPSRYEDFSQIYAIADLTPGQHATVHGIVQTIQSRRSFRRRMTITEALLADRTGSIRAVWFNQPFLRTTLRPGVRANFAGKIALQEHELYFSHPTYEIVGAREKETKHTARLVPVYPETRGLTSKGIRFLVKPILDNLEPPREWMPEDVRAAHNLPELNHALRAIHFPARIEDAERARARFTFEDLFLLQLANLEQKLALKNKKAPALTTDIEWLKRILASLPFALTTSQKKSLWEIVQDLAKPAPMNRLLQGDVGSGKTVVAAVAALIAAQNGYQSAFMAPTEVLARQHFETLRKLFSRCGDAAHIPAVGFLAAGGARVWYGKELESDIKKETLKEKLTRGDIGIAVGTHALISGGKRQAPLAFPALGFVAVDEQHRFGVAQRAALARGEGRVPHFLSMSATPIPRTLMLTVFGDLDVSAIAELPTGRKPIITKAVSPEHRDKAYAFIRKQIHAGRQAFVICPRIEKPEEHYDSRFAIYDKEQKQIELKSVKEEYEKLSKKIFPDLRVAMLHGQMRPKEKEKVMAAFKSREIDVVVSTSVVEVGVDVPNATVMMIEGSDRFGLAQLYQFRGRVGRGAHQSYCFLFTDSSGRRTEARLKAIAEAKNGFELAEMDLKLRGPGQFLGTEQTGLPDLAMAGLQNIQLIKASREAAVRIGEKDPGLKKFPALREKLSEFRTKLHLE
ncbi:MAG: ATP-dependent DNA helicase RecG [Candidatus Liptonbacteria bacterium]|nr:ATP-dependent DNA helicase RecG [Candidatus Liptonbacteria bacterium]